MHWRRIFHGPGENNSSTNAAGNKVLLNDDKKLSAKSANNNDFLIGSNGVPNKVTTITIRDAMTGLKKGHLKTLNGEERSTFKPNVLMEFSPDSISGLKPESLDALNRKQTRAFKNNHLAGLSKKQIKKAKDFIDDLTKKQSKALTTGVSRRTMRTFEPLIQSDDDFALLLGLEPLT